MFGWYFIVYDILMDAWLISIIVPVYNVEPYLRECLDSIINQTYKNLEIIVVDDGSTDNSGKICDEYALKDRRVKVIHQENMDLSCARNVWLKVATWDYIWYVDSDDYLEHDMYEILHNLITKNDADLIICNWYKWLRNGWWVKNEKFPKKECLTTDEAIESFYWAMYVRNKLYKRELVDGYDFVETYAQDVLYNFSLFKRAKKIICVDECKYYYRYNYESRLHGRKFKKNWLVFLNEWINKEIEYAKNNNLFGLERDLLNSRTVILINWLSTMAFDMTPDMKVAIPLLNLVKKNLFFYLKLNRPFFEKCFGVVSCINLRFSWWLYRIINKYFSLNMKKI